MGGMRQGIECELMLWKANYDADTGGRLIFEISKEEIEPFFGLKTKKGGQRFAAVLVLIGDDEKKVPVAAPQSEQKAYMMPDGKLEPAPDGAVTGHRVPEKTKPHFPGGLCGLAVQWGDDPEFQSWLADAHAEDWESAKEFVNMERKDAVSERAAATIKLVCNALSRKNLDTDAGSRAKFEERIRAPYMAYLREGGSDE